MAVPSEKIILIKNLSCSYTRKEEDKILYINNLEIEKGKIVFLLGASGSGKSTLLETLGLMNNTISSGEVKFFDEQNKSHDFSKLWKNDTLDEVNRIRKHFLSFIFQNTNLMENFTAYENICLSQMIKSNTGQANALKGAQKLMEQVGLPESEVGFDKLSVNLSGGQRQRVSFVRALNTDFKILLCDEPTGNLDEVNAHELLNIVKQNLSTDRTALLVSHDISLALKYADQIVLLTKNPLKGYGEVLEENIYYRNQWEQLDEHAYNLFRKKLLGFFVSEGKIKNEVKKEIVDRGASTTYRKLFINKEGKVLFGKSNVNLLILTTIISITLLAIGFANGALNYLNVKLNDTFVNWLTVGIPYSKSTSNTVREFTELLNSDEVRKTYMIDTVTTYKVVPLPFIHGNSSESEFILGRLVAYDDPITKDLFGEKNKVWGADNFYDERDFGIVVTQKMLNRLGYDIHTRVIYLNNDDIDSTQNPPAVFRVPIPVRAVIKEIPGRNSFLITGFFLNSFIATDECVFNFSDQQRKRILFFVEGNKEMAKQLKSEIEKAKASFVLTEKVSVDMDEEFAEDGEDDYAENEDGQSASPAADDSVANQVNEKTQELTIEVNIDTCEQLSIPGYEVSVSFNALPFEYKTTENIYRQITLLPFYKSNNEKIIRIFDYNIAPAQEDNLNNDFLCINFKGGEGGLDSIESFSKFLVNQLNSGKEKDQTNIIEVDAGNIKEKKNFNYISKMTFLISGLLIIFSILAISLFISNLLKTHLNKVKMNIGTYKAFGLSDKESKSIYLQIMIRFILVGLAISFVIAFVLGNIIGKWFQVTLNLEDQSEYFRLFDLQTYSVLAIIIGVTWLVSYININRILSKTPGDLIYNR